MRVEGPDDLRLDVALTLTSSCTPRARAPRRRSAVCSRRCRAGIGLVTVAKLGDLPFEPLEALLHVGAFGLEGFDDLLDPGHVSLALVGTTPYALHRHH